MNLVNSKDIVTGRVRDIQAQAAASGRARQVRGAGQSHGARLAYRASHPARARRGLAVWADVRVLARPHQTI